MSALLAPQFLLSITLLVSGVAKLPDPRATEDAMRSLRLPARGAHPFAARAVPIAEIVLALAWWAPSVPVQSAVAIIVLALMIAYLVIIGRALRFDAPVTCSCFGTLGSPTVSRTTLARNIVLVSLAIVAVAVAASGTAAELLATRPGTVLAWAAAMAVGVVLTGLALGGTTGAAGTGAGAGTAADAAGRPGADGAAGAADGEETDEDGLLDYVRVPTPFGVIRNPDGTVDTLRDITADSAALLLWVNPGCGSCERVIDALPQWRSELDPLVTVHPLVLMPPDRFDPETLARLGDGVGEDVEVNLSVSLGAGGAPSAVLLGRDGLLAGGPVQGSDVIDFVDEIIESLREAREAGEVAADA